MFSVGEILGELSSSMAILDGRGEVGIGFGLGRQLVTHDLDQIVAGQQIGSVAMGQALLGEEHQRDHHQGHVMVPRLPAPDLVVRHAAGALAALATLGFAGAAQAGWSDHHNESGISGSGYVASLANAQGAFGPLRDTDAQALKDVESRLGSVGGRNTP